LGIDKEGNKHVLGFWQGAAENHEVCEELLADMERRGLLLSKKMLFITDGGRGIIKALKERFGAKLLHQRCIIHKDRNIQKHLAKKYRKEAHRRFMAVLLQNPKIENVGICGIPDEKGGRWDLRVLHSKTVRQ